MTGSLNGNEVGWTPHHDIYRRLCCARALIDECCHLPLDLERISKEACLSRYHFLRLFRQAFRRTPHQYLTERRIQKAKELLAAAELSVTDVCFDVGFESLGSFSTLFRRHVGCTPIAYRARMLDLKEFPQKQVPGCFLVMWKLDSSRPRF
jgi:AraC-like DNA-binding protein